MIISKFERGDYVSFEIAPQGGEILDGVRSVYVDGIGRLHITVGFKTNERERKRIDKRNEKLREELMNALTVKSLKPRKEIRP